MIHRLELSHLAFTYDQIAQIGVYINVGRGQLVISLAELLEKLS